MRKYTHKIRKTEKIVSEYCCATTVKGPNNEIIVVSDCCATTVETRNWRLQYHRDRKGLKTSPYAMARDGKRFIYMHVYLWESLYGPVPDGLEIDHINGDTLDNRVSNLRLVTHKENMNNQKQHRNMLTQQATSL